MLTPSRSREALTSAAGISTLLAVFAVSIPVAAVTLTEQVESMTIVPIAGRDVVLFAPEPAPEAPVAPVQLRRVVPRAAVPTPAAAAPAFQAPASLSGVLRDASGAVLPGVQLTLANTAAGTSYTGVTDAAGRFAFRNVPAARYELTARLPGFRSIADAVTLSGGDDQQLSLTMQVGGLAETIIVRCGAGAATLPRNAATALLAFERRSTVALARRSLGEGGSLFASPQAAQSLPIRVGGQIAAPRQIATASPACPSVGGGLVVILEATIGVDGGVRDIVSLRPRMPDEQQAPFVQSAIEAVRQWQYTPTRLNNVPIPVIITITVSYTTN